MTENDPFVSSWNIRAAVKDFILLAFTQAEYMGYSASLTAGVFNNFWKVSVIFWVLIGVLFFVFLLLYINLKILCEVDNGQLFPEGVIEHK